MGGDPLLDVRWRCPNDQLEVQDELHLDIGLLWSKHMISVMPVAEQNSLFSPSPSWSFLYVGPCENVIGRKRGAQQDVRQTLVEPDRGLAVGAR